MERREFFKIAAGVATGAVAFAVTAQAAPPLMPRPLNEDAKLPENPAQPAVTSQEEIDHLQPEEVQWGRRHWRRPGWRGRRWGWRRPHRRWTRRW